MPSEHVRAVGGGCIDVAPESQEPLAGIDIHREQQLPASAHHAHRNAPVAERIDRNRRDLKAPDVARDLHLRRRMHAAIELAGFAAAQAAC